MLLWVLLDCCPPPLERTPSKDPLYEAAGWGPGPLVLHTSLLIEVDLVPLCGAVNTDIVLLILTMCYEGLNDKGVKYPATCLHLGVRE